MVTSERDIMMQKTRQFEQDQLAYKLQRRLKQQEMAKFWREQQEQK
jgi:hypothetical protein